MRISDWSSDVCSSDLNYEVGLQKLKDCDLIIEAIAERMDWKLDLYEKIAPFVADHAVLASNTSGLGINKLAEVLPEKLRSRDRKSVVSGKSGSVRVDLGGRGISKKKTNREQNT